MPSLNTYRLTCVSLTLDVGYLFTAAPAKCSCCCWLGQTAQKRGHEELPLAQGQGRLLRGAGPGPSSGAAVERTCHMPEVRGSSQEELPHIQGAAAASAQED